MLTTTVENRTLSDVEPSRPWRGGDSLSVVTWNLGYGGLGAGSDFFADGGKSYLPPSRDAVRSSQGAIAAWLGGSGADVILTQETADASVVNYWTSLRSRLDKALSTYGRVFRPDFHTRLLPPPFRIRNGAATYVRTGRMNTVVWPLPDDGDPYGGPLRRRYGALATRAEGPGGCWVFVNVHLSAFDEGAALRRRQLVKLFALAQTELAAGHRVVLGGDFNLRLTATDFPYTTEQRHLFWIYDFPTELLPEGWRIVADRSVASVRTNEQPYLKGRNYETVVDGFIISPNVAVTSVTGTPMNFSHSDHQPVRMEVRALGAESASCFPVS